jgi:hypothetical protein
MGLGDYLSLIHMNFHPKRLLIIYNGNVHLNIKNNKIYLFKILDGTCLSFHDFTRNWIDNFHDHHDTAHAFFNNLDLNNDKQLCLDDISVQLLKYDTNPSK